MNFMDPFVIDRDNDVDKRPITWEYLIRDGRIYLIYSLPSLDGMIAPVVDPTLTLQPDGTAGEDTRLLSDNADTNYGMDDLRVGEENDEPARVQRTLIKFDLSDLPSNADISSATLSLYLYTDKCDNARTFRVYRQKRAWVESEATWNIYSTGNSWQTAGGFGADDCEQSDIGNRAMSDSEASEFKDWSLSPTTKAGLDLGNGWLIKADTESDDAYRFYSSDYGTAANRPKLVIVYTVPRVVSHGFVNSQDPGIS